MSLPKCEIIGASADSIKYLELHGIVLQSTAKTEVTLLGAPLHKVSIEKILTAKMGDLETLCNRLCLLPKHHSLFLLRNALAIPKLLYILRTSPCFHSSALNNYDNSLRQTLSTVLNIDIDDSRWQQASLPVRDGGLGIRSAVSLAPSAFLSSATSTANLVSQILPPRMKHISDVNIPVALDLWQSLAGSLAIAPSGDSACHQRSWDSPCCKAKADILLSSVSDIIDRARLLASRAPHSGDWLHALPLSAMGLKLEDEAVRIAVALRIGAPVVHEHRCICGALVGVNGHHGLHCQRSAGRQSRHKNVNNIIHKALQKAGISAILEPSGLCTADDRRPDGVSLIPWSKGKCLIWDFTCPDTLAPSHLSSTSTTVGSAAYLAEKNKLAKYIDLSSTYVVTPFAIETLGTWGKHGDNFIKQLGSRTAEVTHDLRSLTFLRQKIAIAVQRGNALSVLSTHRHLSHVQYNNHNKDMQDYIGNFISTVREDGKSGKYRDDTYQQTLEYRPVCREWQKAKSYQFEVDLVKPNSICHGTKPRYIPSTAMPDTVSIKGDGNCLFRSLSFVICGDQDFHGNIRSGIVDFMRRSDEVLKHSRSGECTIEQYLIDTQMDNDGVWGTEVEIFAAATMLRTPIYVFSLYGAHYQWLRFSPVPDSYGIIAVTDETDEDELHSGEAIYITNVGQHFEPVRFS
jgi:hypothetical protein